MSVKWKERIRANDWSAYLFIFPAISVIALFILYPAIWSLITSFRSVNPIQMRTSSLFAIPGAWVGLDNYRSIFQSELFLKSLFNTAYFAIIFVPLTMAGSLLLAILLDSGVRGTRFMRTVFFLPYVISIISASLIFMLLFSGERGLVNALLRLIGLSGPNWLGHTLWAMPVIALMSCWRQTGYFMIIYLAGLQVIPTELYEAADIDGAGRWQQFVHLTWPLLGRINLVVFILLLVNSLRVFQEVFVMTGGGPADSTITVPFLIYNEAFRFFRFGRAAAMSYVLFVLVVAVNIVQTSLASRKLDY